MSNVWIGESWIGTIDVPEPQNSPSLVPSSYPVYPRLYPPDTEAMAGLAFTCLERFFFNPDLRPRITMAIETVREKILKAQTPEGNFGNVYSTPLALQVGKRSWNHDHSTSQWRVGWLEVGSPGSSPVINLPPPSLPHSF